MSADALVLKALAIKTKNELRYFEYMRVELSYGGVGGYSKIKDVFVCIGRHAIYLVRGNLSNLVKGGALDYLYLQKVSEDSKGYRGLQLVFAGSITSEISRCLMFSEKRSTFVSKLSTCFLADAMCRDMQISNFPIVVERLHLPKAFPHAVRPSPFRGFDRRFYQDYLFFLPECFKDEPSATSKTKTGMYKAPIQMFTRNRELEQEVFIEVSVHVYDPVPIANLAKIGREHIRWVATEYKQSLVHEQLTWVLSNQQYLKKMNLSNDPASWVCWEMMLKGERSTTFCIVLRRSYMPPLCDQLQDFAILVKCPTKFIAEGDPRERERDQKIQTESKLEENELRNLGVVLADTFGPANMSAQLYPELIQAKLDALLFDEEGYAWCWSRLKKRPQGEARVEMFAHLFVKGIIRILRDESVLTHPTLYADISRQAQELMYKVPGAQAHEDVDPMTVATKLLRYPADGINWLEQEDHELGSHNVARANQWHAKVARYLAYCVDGGLLPGKFSLADIVSTLCHAVISDEATEKLKLILDFLLHIRSRDPVEKWAPKPLNVHLEQIASLDTEFNDKVIQVLLELNYARLLMADEGVVRHDTNPAHVPISTEYANQLTHLLQADTASINVKASICRQIVKERDTEMGPVMCIGLLDVLNKGSVFLQTYACAAVVNLSQAKEVVKNRLMRRDVATTAMRLLKSKDDDLILYTLMLLVHLTKLVHHRRTMVQAGLMPIVNDILEQSYEVVQYKRRILVECCSVLGQMCNDEDTRKLMCENYTVVDSLLHIMDGKSSNPPKPWSSSTSLSSKVMFALKQLCANSQDVKEKVGKKVIKPILLELQDTEKQKDKDWGVNAIMLLVILAIHEDNVRQMVFGGTWESANDCLAKSDYATMDATRDRIQQIDARVESVKDKIEKESRGG